jgi:aspartate/glutamate racemase
MKHIGLIGGLSPESTVHYYQIVYDTTRIHAEAILEFALGRKLNGRK